LDAVSKCGSNLLKIELFVDDGCDSSFLNELLNGLEILAAALFNEGKMFVLFVELWVVWLLLSNNGDEWCSVLED